MPGACRQVIWCCLHALLLDKLQRQQVVRGLMKSLRLPGLPLFRWLERHAALRMSILLTYLFGKSELATQMLQQLLLAFRILGRTLRPLFSFLQPALTAMQVGQLCNSKNTMPIRNSTLQLYFVLLVCALNTSSPPCLQPRSVPSRSQTDGAHSPWLISVATNGPSLSRPLSLAERPEMWANFATLVRLDPHQMVVYWATPTDTQDRMTLRLPIIGPANSLSHILLSCVADAAGPAG